MHLHRDKLAVLISFPLLCLLSSSFCSVFYKVINRYTVTMSSKPMVSPSLPRIKGRDVTLLSMIILADAQPIVLHQLVKASPEQVTVATERQADSPWAKIVSKQDFLKQVESRALFTLAYGSCYIQRREAMLVEFQMAKDRELTAWVLVPGDDQASTDFYCSCETYKRPMWYRKHV